MEERQLNLIRKAIRGDRKAFAKLCEARAREVVFLCTRELGNLHDGQDASQEVFIRMQKNITELRAAEAFNVWLNRLVHTTCLNMRRDNMNHTDSIQFSAGSEQWIADNSDMIPQALVESEEKRQRLSELVDALPDRHHTCILLRFYQNLSYAEIAEVMGISTVAVDNSLRMARRLLRLEMEAYYSAEVKEESRLAKTALPMVMLGPALQAGLSDWANATVSGSICKACLAGAGLAPAVSAFGGAATAMLAVGAACAVTVFAVSALRTPSTPAPAPSAAASALPQGDTGAGTAGQAGVEDTLVRAVPQLSGRVYINNDTALDPEALNGLESIQLDAVRADDPNGASYTAMTSGGEDTGSFALDNLPEGEYKLRILLPASAAVSEESPAEVVTGWFEPRVGWVQVNGQETFFVGPGYEPVAGLDIELEIPARLAGNLQLQRNGSDIEYDGDLIPGVSLLLLDPQGREIAETAITVEGDFLFQNPMISQRGAYTLRVVNHSGAPAALTIEDITAELYPGYGAQ